MVDFLCEEKSGAFDDAVRPEMKGLLRSSCSFWDNSSRTSDRHNSARQVMFVKKTKAVRGTNKGAVHAQEVGSGSFVMSKKSPTKRGDKINKRR